MMRSNTLEVPPMGAAEKPTTGSKIVHDLMDVIGVMRGGITEIELKLDTAFGTYPIKSEKEHPELPPIASAILELRVLLDRIGVIADRVQESL